MKTSGVLLVFTGLVFGLALAAATLGVVTWFENQDLRRDLADLRLERQAAIDARRDADLERARIDSNLAAQHDQVARLKHDLTVTQAELDALRADNPTPRHAKRAQVYAGRQLLGEGWILPPSGGTNANAHASPPVVILDETLLRGLVTAAARETSQRERNGAVTVNHNYPQPYYVGTAWWPSAWSLFPPGTNSPPSDDRFPTPPPRVPQDSRTFNDSGIWRPTGKPFLPNPSTWPIVTPNQASAPMIRSSPRPTTLGTPMTSPAPAPRPMAAPTPVQPLRR